MRMRRDNRGFSLVELIITISIMAIFSAFAVTGISVLTGAKVNKVCQNTVAIMQRCQTLSLGKGEGQVEACVFVDGSTGNIVAQLYQGSTLLSEEVLGNSSVEVTVYFQGDTAGYALSSVQGKAPARETAGIHVMFQRGTGAFTENTNEVAGVEKKYIEKIVFAATGREKEIRLVGVTGKIID